MLSNVFPVSYDDQILVALIVRMMGQVVVQWAVVQIEAGNDGAHGGKCGRTLLVAAELHAEIRHHYLLQVPVSTSYPHGERRLVVVGHTPGQSPRTCQMVVDCRFHDDS